MPSKNTGGSPGKQSTWTARLHFRFVSGNQRWEEWLYLTTDNGQGVAIAFSTLPTVWDAWKPVFERAIQESSGSRPLLTPR